MAKSHRNGVLHSANKSCTRGHMSWKRGDEKRELVAAPHTCCGWMLLRACLLGSERRYHLQLVRSNLDFPLWSTVSPRYNLCNHCSYIFVWFNLSLMEKVQTIIKIIVFSMLIILMLFHEKQEWPNLDIRNIMSCNVIWTSPSWGFSQHNDHVNLLWANSTDPDMALHNKASVRVYTVCHSPNNLIQIHR